jgi:hypothetical protein
MRVIYTLSRACDVLFTFPVYSPTNISPFAYKRFSTQTVSNLAVGKEVLSRYLKDAKRELRLQENRLGMITGVIIHLSIPSPWLKGEANPSY